MVLMQVVGLTLDVYDETPILVLRQTNTPFQKRPWILPIWLGLPEAMCLSTALNRFLLPQPMPQDILLSAIQAMGGQITCIALTQFDKNGLFHARLDIIHQKHLTSLECRITDAALLSIRLGLNIFVDEDVLQRAKIGRVGLNSTENCRRPCDNLQQMIHDTSEDYLIDQSVNPENAQEKWMFEPPSVQNDLLSTMETETKRMM